MNRNEEQFCVKQFRSIAVLQNKDSWIFTIIIICFGAQNEHQSGADPGFPGGGGVTNLLFGQIFLKKECIPVGCVPSAAVVVSIVDRILDTCL